MTLILVIRFLYDFEDKIVFGVFKTVEDSEKAINKFLATFKEFTPNHFITQEIETGEVLEGNGIDFKV
jgi:hypothetical protein